MKYVYFVCTSTHDDLIAAVCQSVKKNYNLKMLCTINIELGSIKTSVIVLMSGAKENCSSSYQELVAGILRTKLAILSCEFLHAEEGR